MSKRYLHSAGGSKIVEDGSTEMIELLSGGTWFKDKADIETPVTGEATVTGEITPLAPGDDSEKIANKLSTLEDQPLIILYEEVDAEMVKRGLLEPVELIPDENPVVVGEERVMPDYDAMSDEALKEVGRELKIPSFASMKRETLLEKIKEISNA